jgi:hypothetical protein
MVRGQGPGRLAWSALPLVLSLGFAGVTVAATTPHASGVPGAPKIGGAAPSGRSGEALVTFQPAANRGSSKVSRYIASCSARDQQTRSSEDSAPPFSRIRVKGMTNGVTYSCVVRAKNAAGVGAKSKPASVLVGAPTAPSSIAVGKPTAGGTLKLSVGAAKSFPTAPVTRYEGQCSAAGGVTRKFAAGSQPARVTIRGLTRNKAYRCKARAIDRYGAGPYVTQPSCKALAPNVNLDAPKQGVRLQSGRKASLCGSGYRPGARVKLVLHSTPTPLGTMTADANGMIDGSVTIPSSTPDGSHTVTASGASADGTLTQSAPVNVSYDITPPSLEAFSLSPTSINTLSSDQAITAAAHITDDRAGASLSVARFRSPSGVQFVDANFYVQDRVSGTPKDGTYSYSMTVPQFAEHGTWTLEFFYLSDAATNATFLSAAQVAALGFPTTFQQTGAGDTAPPSLEGFSLSPTSIDTSSSAQTITATAHITDNLAGIVHGAGLAEARFRSPSGQFVNAPFYSEQRVSGTAQDGIYSYDMTVPQFSEEGTWTLEYFYLSDAATNATFLSAAQVAALGFPTTFTNGP